LASPQTGDTFFVATADFDGDLRDDVLSVELSTVGVHFSDANGESDQSARMYSPPFEPAIGRFSDVGGAGFAVGVGGISMQRGRADHSLSAGAYAPFPVNPDTVAMGVFDAKPATFVNEFSNLGSEVVSFAPVGTSVQVSDVLTSQDLFTIGVGQSEVANEVLHADTDVLLNEGHELIVPKPGTNEIHVFGMSALDAASQSYHWHDTPTHTTVRLQAPYKLPAVGPLGAKPPPPTVVVGQLNADEFVDVIAMGVNAGDQRIMVALGDGNGQFYSSTAAFAANTPDDQLGPFTQYNLNFIGDQIAKGRPLAVADLNGDTVPDFVVENGINLSAGGGIWIGVVGAEFPWHAAAIGDFNGDDFPDVVAATHDGRRVDLHVGTLSGFNTTHVPTKSKISGFTAGDFDGNLVGDVAVSESETLSDGTKEDVLSVLFGRVGAPLEPPVELGRFEKIRQLASGNVATLIGTLDDVSDIGVFASTGDVPTAALFVGDTQRRIESPFSLTHAPNTPEESLAFAVRVAAGNFDGIGPNDDLAILTAPPQAVPQLDPHTRLWLSPATGDAELSLSTSRESDPIQNDQLARCGMLFAALDLGGDELDELVTLGFTAADVPRGQVIVSRSVAVDGAHRFQIDPPTDVNEAYIGRVAVLACGLETDDGVSAEDLPLDGQLQVVDVNADGHEDILALALEISPPPEFGLIPRLVYYENHYDGQLDVAGRVMLEVEGSKPDSRLRSFVAAELDGDPAPEILLILGDSVHRGEIDLAQRRVVDVTPLEGLPQGTLLSRGDLNGDGVNDLVIAGSSGVNLVRGVPVLR
jgi:hypothetical protein